MDYLSGTLCLIDMCAKVCHRHHCSHVVKLFFPFYYCVWFNAMKIFIISTERKKWEVRLISDIFLPHHDSEEEKKNVQISVTWFVPRGASKKCSFESCNGNLIRNQMLTRTIIMKSEGKGGKSEWERETFRNFFGRPPKSISDINSSSVATSLWENKCEFFFYSTIVWRDFLAGIFCRNFVRFKLFFT